LKIRLIISEFENEGKRMNTGGDEAIRYLFMHAIFRFSKIEADDMDGTRLVETWHTESRCMPSCPMPADVGTELMLYVRRTGSEDGIVIKPF
jgi:hypothetical protein